jgi:hypothetical protein
MGTAEQRTQVFVSYSRKDATYLERVQVFLTPLVRAEQIKLWVDTDLRPGDKWKAEIETALSAAKVAILVVSADFFASKFIHEVELPALLARAQDEGATILPLLVGPCNYKDSVLAGFQRVNDLPLMDLSRAEREKVYERLAGVVERLVDLPNSADPLPAAGGPPEFRGRGPELATLLDAWKTAQRGPAVVVLHGPTGRGKTRLVQQFYARIAEEQTEPYWPPEIGPSLMPSGTPPEHVALPWLWLTVLCLHAKARNDAGASLRPLELLRDQARRHLPAIYASVARGEPAERPAATDVATFALPGSGAPVEIGSKIADHLDRGSGPVEAVRDLAHHVGNVGPRPTGSDPDAEVKAFGAELIEALRAVVENVETSDGRHLRIVLIVEDAHWAAKDPVGVLKQVMRCARDERWPMLLIVSTWKEGLGGKPLASLIETFETNTEDAGASLSFASLAVEPLGKPSQEELLKELVPTLPVRQHGILLKRSDGDLELLRDYCVKLASEWPEVDGRIVITDSELENMAVEKTKMARSLIESVGDPLMELLAMGSAQGWKFFGSGTAAMLREHGGDDHETMEELLRQADQKYRICAVALHDILGQSAEFRALPYYEISRERFDAMPDWKALLRALADALHDQYLEDRFSALSAIDRVEVMEDLVEAGRRLGLRAQRRWADILDDCALDVAALQVSLGHLGRAREAAERVLRIRGADSERGQRALVTLCEAAHAANDTKAEDELLDLWWDVPDDRRHHDAFVRQARRDIRIGRGDLARERLDELLGREGHADPDRLLFKLERALALC